MPEDPISPSRRPILAAWSVHVLTASGLVWGLLALEAIGSLRLREALGWMALAVLIDGVDGTLARRLRVKTQVPSIDGELLDNLVDFLNYVIVPVWLIHRAGLLPVGWSLAGAGLIAVVSGFQFAHRDAKSAGEWFRGFPSYWNILALYLLLLRPPPAIAFIVVLVLAALALAPVRFVYPTRTRAYRGLTLTLIGVWSLVAGLLVWRYPAHPRWLVWASLVFGLYYIGLSVALARRTPSSSPGG